jgi:hypothetical protein
MTDDALTKVKILKWTRLLEGGETEQSVIDHAISRNWLDPLGAPTPHGRLLVHSFEKMNSLSEPRL